MAVAQPLSPSLAELECRLGRDWQAIRKAHETTRLKREELDATFAGLGSSDTSLVVFGSVARQEVTAGSDLDWILLIDGQSIPEHKIQEQDIARLLREKRFVGPGRSGVFGRMVGSHGLIHNIGGEDDLNSNTTRRILLLLESHPVGNREAFDRVRRQIISRYLGDDRGLTHASGDVRIPRFLLNDLTRYWRTVTVDFVYKQRADEGEKWALRNAKLRMSRKLIFAAGLAIVFRCHLDPAAESARLELRQDRTFGGLTAYLESQFSRSPLEILAQTCWDLKVSTEIAATIFDRYNEFLTILDDAAQRDELERSKNDADLRTSEAWEAVRKVSHPFHDALVSLFLRDNDELSRLTMEYGLF